jgi:predicted DNA-binding transcriptional regulator YafY
MFAFLSTMKHSFGIVVKKKGAAKMNGLLLTSKEEKMPIELMYISEDQAITYRRVIVTSIDENYIKAFCFTRNQKRTFKRSNILAVAKPRERKVANYA